MKTSITSLSDLQGAIASSLTCVQLHKRAEKIAAVLGERAHLQDGDHVALVYPPGELSIFSFCESTSKKDVCEIKKWLLTCSNTDL